MHDVLGHDLTAWRDRPAPRLLLLESRAGGSARRRLARAIHDVTWLRPQPGGGSALVLGLLDDLVREDVAKPDDAPDPTSDGWPAVWATWRTRAAAEAGRTWVLDARIGLPAAAWDALARSWAGVRGQALPVRLVILVPPSGTERLAELPHDRLVAAPTDAWTWASELQGWHAADRVRAAAIFGSEDRFRTLVDPSRSLERNVRSLVLAPDAPMATAALDRVRHAVQRPERYIRAARAVAMGATEWGMIRRGVGGLASSGQLGPYLRTLEELGVIRAVRSLDASPGSRSARYCMADPWLGFWFACVLPSWSRLGTTDPKLLWNVEVRPRLSAHMDRTLPHLIREWMASPSARSLLGSSAREVGGLWGDGYEMPLAGTLQTGAIAYGWSRWSGGGFEESEVAAATRQVRATRYGFGRENRLKLFVQRAPVEHDLARIAARDPETKLLSIEDLFA